MTFVERVWYGDGAAAAGARTALWPLEQIYRAGIAARAALYHRHLLPRRRADLPTISVGNLTVGGTGKTPFAAWLARRLAEEARPAIVLRGYGSDEAEVHRRLNDDVPVIVGADRVAAVRGARERGADVVVLDDAFQHRRIARTADIVLVSAEQLRRPPRLLPAGPWREPLAAAARADLLVVTRKTATDAEVARALEALHGAAPSLPVATVALAPAALVDVRDGTMHPLTDARGVDVLVIAAIGEPAEFAAQVAALGARVTLAAFRDHHPFSASDVRSLAARVGSDGLAVCTLKDAVKLADLWPPSPRLWYVSQHLVVETGARDMDALLHRVLAARAPTATTAG